MLAAYGVPMISDEGKFTSTYIKLNDGGQKTICAFAFPANWVEAKREGFMTAANYQSGDGLVFNVGTPHKAKAIGDIGALTIVAESTPSGGVAKVNRKGEQAHVHLLPAPSQENIYVWSHNATKCMYYSSACLPPGSFRLRRPRSGPTSKRRSYKRCA